MLEYNSEEMRSIVKFEQMLKTNSVYFFDAQEFECIITHYLSQGKIQLAKEALKTGINQHSENESLLLLKSELLIIEEHFEKATELLNYIDKISPLNEEVLLQKATIASKKGNHERATNLLYKVLEIAEDPFEVWNLLGMEYLLVEDYSNAIPFFKNCIYDTPNDHQSLYNLLYCYEELDEDEAAVEILNHVLEKDPYSEIAWHQLGKLFSKMGRNKEALSAFEFTIISDDTFTGAYIEIGKLLEKEGRLNEAITNYEIALKIDDPSSFVYHRIGNCHLKLGNDKLTIAYFLKAVHVEPTSERSWIALIDYYITKKDFQKGLFYIRKALRANADCIGLWERSMAIHKHLKLTDEVLLAYQNMLDLGNLNWNIWISFIDELIQLQDWNKALETAHKAKHIFPETTKLDYRISGCYLRLGRKAEAVFFFQNAQKCGDLTPQILRLFPEFNCTEQLSMLRK